MLILLEDYTVNDPVLACPSIVDANGNSHFDSGFHGVLVEDLAAAIEHSPHPSIQF